LSTSTHNASKQKPTDDTINLLEGVDSFRCHVEIYPVVAQEPNQPYDILDTYDGLAVKGISALLDDRIKQVRKQWTAELGNWHQLAM